MPTVTSFEQPKVASAFGPTSTASEVILGHDLSGKTAIITGGSSGIGIETARTLAGAGAEVIIAVRNTAQGSEVASELNREIGVERVFCEQLDLASLQSVRTFAQRWGDKPLHFLINNAGVMACPLGYTEDGFETQYGVNHLGHFLLTNLLTPALIRSAPARVISLASAAHKLGGIDFEDPHFRSRPYDLLVSYGQSKTANVLFAVAYDQRHRASGVRALAVMPGVIETNLMRHMSPEVKAKMVPTKDMPSDTKDRSRLKSPEQGAATTVWAVVAIELEGHGSLYLEDCGVAKVSSPDSRGGSGVMGYALDPIAAERLWTISVADTGLTVDQ